jgi:hypothetical protein
VAEAREAFATVVANELELSLDEEVLAAIDRLLAALWVEGFKIVSHDG